MTSSEELWWLVPLPLALAKVDEYLQWALGIPGSNKLPLPIEKELSGAILMAVLCMGFLSVNDAMICSIWIN